MAIKRNTGEMVLASVLSNAELPDESADFETFCHFLVSVAAANG